MDQKNYSVAPQCAAFALAILGLLFLRVAAAATALPERIYSGDAFRLQSKAMNETRRYLVQVPEDYAFVDDAYPVLVLLDGDEYFQLISATVKLLASTGRIPEMIVVGVPNTNRFRDLSPLPPAPGDSTAREDWPRKFSSFMSDELLPEIDRSYRTRPYRVLIGHSVGGLFVVYSMMNAPAAFRGYISISPAFADNRALVNEVEPFLLSNKNLQADFYMTMANERGQQLGGAWALSSILQEKASRDLRWQFQRYPEESHFSVIHRSVYDGLQFVFQGWNLMEPFALYEQGGLAAIEKHYGQLSARVGYDVPMAEGSLTSILNSVGSRNRHAEGEQVVTKVLALYPNSSNVHFTLARFFSGMKDEQRAIAHLTRTLELYPDNGTARRMLTALKMEESNIAPPVQLPAATLRSYHGFYRSAQAELHVTEENGVLFATNGLARHQLRPITVGHFYCVDGDKQFKFVQNRNGRIEKLVVAQDGEERELSRQR
jgi:predicted alpha/beta superfamily hydrolase